MKLEMTEMHVILTDGEERVALQVASCSDWNQDRPREPYVAGTAPKTSSEQLYQSRVQRTLTVLVCRIRPAIPLHLYHVPFY